MFKYDDEIGTKIIIPDEVIQKVREQEVNVYNEKLRKKVKGYEVIYENVNVGIYWCDEIYNEIIVISDKLTKYSIMDFIKHYDIQSYAYIDILYDKHPRDIEIYTSFGNIEGQIKKSLFKNKKSYEFFDCTGEFISLNNTSTNENILTIYPLSDIINKVDFYFCSYVD